MKIKGYVTETIYSTLYTRFLEVFCIYSCVYFFFFFPESVVYIPPPPVPPEIVGPALNALGEPTLQSLGLGSYWTPAGLVQNLLDFLHVSGDLPWWAAIACGK